MLTCVVSARVECIGQLVTSVAEEKKLNPRLTKPLDEFVNIMNNLNLPYPKFIGQLAANTAIVNIWPTVYIHIVAYNYRKRGMFQLFIDNNNFDSVSKWKPNNCVDRVCNPHPYVHLV